MKTNEQLKKEQDKLDEEMTICPKCGKEETWGMIRKWGDCGECVDKYHKDLNKNENN
jgi:hypothetical protein